MDRKLNACERFIEIHSLDLKLREGKDRDTGGWKFFDTDLCILLCKQYRSMDVVHINSSKFADVSEIFDTYMESTWDIWARRRKWDEKAMFPSDLTFRSYFYIVPLFAPFRCR